MADKKISALTAASTPLAGSEVLPVVQSGSTVKVSVANLTAGRDTVAGSLTATGAPTGSLGVSKILTQFETSQIARSYVCGPDASTYGRWEIYRSSSTTPALGWSFAANGDLEVANGNLIQGTAAKGVNFTANTPAAGMTSQLLNWYEEGTWTPAYEAYAGAFTTLTYTSQQGTYTRIGRTVICNFNIIVNAVTTGTAATLLLLKGFPFAMTSDGVAAGRVGGFINFYTGWTTNAPTMVNWAGFTDKLGLLYSGTTNISNTPPANVTAGCELHGCVIYQI